MQFCMYNSMKKRIILKKLPLLGDEYIITYSWKNYYIYIQKILSLNNPEHLNTYPQIPTKKIRPSDRIFLNFYWVYSKSSPLKASIKSSFALLAFSLALPAVCLASSTVSLTSPLFFFSR